MVSQEEARLHAVVAAGLPRQKAPVKVSAPDVGLTPNFYPNPNLCGRAVRASTPNPSPNPNPNPNSHLGERGGRALRARLRATELPLACRAVVALRQPAAEEVRAPYVHSN